MKGFLYNVLSVFIFSPVDTISTKGCGPTSIQTHFSILEVHRSQITTNYYMNTEICGYWNLISFKENC